MMLPLALLLILVPALGAPAPACGADGASCNPNGHGQACCPGLTCLPMSASCGNGAVSFEAYVSEHGKAEAYGARGGAEWERREALYASRVASNEDFNTASPFAAHIVKGVNHMSDWTEQERASLFGLNKAVLMRRKSGMGAAATAALWAEEQARAGGATTASGMPSSWDWASKGALTKPRNQGTCGSCWSFAGTEAIESALFISSGKLLELSPQAFSDCTPEKRGEGGRACERETGWMGG